MKSVYRFLSSYLLDFKRFWTVNDILNYLNHNDSTTKYYAILNISLLLGMTDEETTKLVDKTLLKEQQEIAIAQ